MWCSGAHARSWTGQNGKFGATKLEVGRFLSALLRTNNPTVAQRYLQLGVFPLCLVPSPAPTTLTPLLYANVCVAFWLTWFLVGRR